MLKVYKISEYVSDNGINDLVKKARKIFGDTVPSEEDIMLRLNVSRYEARKILERLVTIFMEKLKTEEGEKVPGR